MDATTHPEFLLPGATAVLDALAERGDVPPGVAAARALAGGGVRWQQAREAIAATPTSVILGRRPDGPVLAARRVAPDEATPVHGHGVPGAILVVEGRLRYERFGRRDAGRARLESVHELAAGDTFWWGAPPDDVHRISTDGAGAMALVLLPSPPGSAEDLTEDPRTTSALVACVERAWLTGDVEALRPHYHPEVLADIGVPQWRFQVRGRDEVLQTLAEGEFVKPDRRLHELRTTTTESGLVVETETRYREDGQTCRTREAHHLRCRDGVVVEHVVWCTGVADAGQLAEQQAHAPMERA